MSLTATSEILTEQELAHFRAERMELDTAENEEGRRAGIAWVKTEPRPTYAELRTIAKSGITNPTAYDIAEAIGGDVEAIFGEDSDNLSEAWLSGWLQGVSDAFDCI